MPHAFKPPETCPVCGESVPPGAKACPGCGADERSGWDDEATRYDGLDLPDESFDREKFLEKEFGQLRRKSGKEWLWWSVGLVLLVLVVLAVFFRG
jgi:predicted nucleic acid-binding Zn ribbon protein